MSAGIKANNDGSGAIQVGGSDYITISTAGAVSVPQTLAVIGATTLPTIKSNAVATPPTIQDSAGTQIGTFCRAWVNFNGTGTVAIRASFNVTSITDNGTGDYTVNFTSALQDANYSAVVSISRSDTPNGIGNINGSAAAPTASALRVYSMTTSTVAAVDGAYAMVSVFR